MAAVGHRMHGHRILQDVTPASAWSRRCLAGNVSNGRTCVLFAGQLDRIGQSGHLQTPHPALIAARRPSTAAAATQPDGWYERSDNRSRAKSPGTSSVDNTDKKQRSRHYYESTSKRRQRGEQQPQDDYKASQQQQQQYSSRDGQEAAGWWEIPREARTAQQAAAATLPVEAQLDLLPWQEERLLLSASASKKKTQVQELAQDLGLDRSEVLAWLAAFRAKPKQEQEKLLAPLQHKIQQQQAATKQQQQQIAARKQPQPPQQQQQQQDIIDSSWQEPTSVASRSSSGGALPFSSSNPDTGFIPYAERRGAGVAKSGKRLSGEVLRTLEGVYSRSPWPSREVVQGLFDLHKIHRDVVLEWFDARRQMDGLPDNPRTAKRAGITAPSAAAQMQQQQALIPKPAEAEEDTHKQQKQQKQQQPNRAAAEAAAAAVPVSRLTARELAALRSSLPSPKKFKGEKLQKELGIKAVKGSGPVPQQIEISGVVFVARDGAAAWRNAWRRRRAKGGLPAQKLDFHNLF